MKLRYLLFAFVILVIGEFNQCAAQSYSIIPNDTVEISAFMEDLEVLSIQMQNLSASPLTLKWQKVSASVPPAWEAKVCDNVLCYPALSDSGTMNPVNPGGYGYLLIHYTAHVNFGTAVVRYAVWDAAFPQFTDTLTYIMHVYDPTGFYHADEPISVILYPNPSSETLHLAGLNSVSFTFTIYDQQGKLAGRNEKIINNKIPVSYLNTGVYFLQLQSSGKTIIRKFIKE
jgi:hypothetical protein